MVSVTKYGKLVLSVSEFVLPSLLCLNEPTDIVTKYPKMTLSGLGSSQKPGVAKLPKKKSKGSVKKGVAKPLQY